MYFPMMFPRFTIKSHQLSIMKTPSNLWRHVLEHPAVTWVSHPQAVTCASIHYRFSRQNYEFMGSNGDIDILYITLDHQQQSI